MKPIIKLPYEYLCTLKCHVSATVWFTMLSPRTHIHTHTHTHTHTHKVKKGDLETTYNAIVGVKLRVYSCTYVVSS